MLATPGSERVKRGVHLQEIKKYWPDFMWLSLGNTVTLWLAHWAPDQEVWVRALVFLCKTLYSHSAFLHPGGTGKLSG